MFFNIAFTPYLIVATLLIFLPGCASNTPEAIETTERFTTQVSEAGRVQFAFGLLWKNTQVDPSYYRQNSSASRSEDRVNTGKNQQPSNNRFDQTPDKQTKLELEDLAAISLAKKLEDEALCKNGYTVEKVIWENQRIRLMGFCL